SMHDDVVVSLRAAIRRRLADLRLPPTREAEIVDELSQHLHDRYLELRAAGSSDDDVLRAVVAEIDDDWLSRELSEIEARAPSDPIVPRTTLGRTLAAVWRDARLALRAFRKTP